MSLLIGPEKYSLKDTNMNKMEVCITWILCVCMWSVLWKCCCRWSSATHGWKVLYTLPLLFVVLSLWYFSDIVATERINSFKFNTTTTVTTTPTTTITITTTTTTATTTATTKACYSYYCCVSHFLFLYLLLFLFYFILCLVYFYFFCFEHLL